MKINKTLAVLKIFALSLELTSYINAMSKLMKNEKDFIKNKFEINENIQLLDLVKNQLNELEALDVTNTELSADLVKNLNVNIDMFYLLHRQIPIYYNENDINGLLKVSELFKELDMDTVSMENDVNFINIMKTSIL